MKALKYLILSAALSMSSSLLAATEAATGCLTAPGLGVSITTPTSDFILQGSVAIHKKTGLMWQRCMAGEVLDDKNTPDGSDDICVESPVAATVTNTYTWSQKAVAGYTDWRLPNLKELYSIEEECPTVEGHLLNLTVFPVSSANRGADKLPVLLSSTNLMLVKQIIDPANSTLAIRLVREMQPAPATK
ncbi:DUF1566 domain-containing protein [Thiofilum flexile]|uniref:Lcl C-terminal domain-containing protein n=1 Tax=Thiofilum flexile TaxID=125627 RepID=UPI00036C319E|nr:DUF1566 domain-containing protein [Thiofilum flexile]